MDALQSLLDLLKKKHLVQGHLLGFLHVLIGRKIIDPGGATISTGLVWRDLAALLRKSRWGPELVRELALDPDELPPRDRQRFWYSAIIRAQVDSPAAHLAGDRFAEVLRSHGYEVK